jgi:glycolate dehydrogenase iron-sulfur subunit
MKPDFLQNIPLNILPPDDVLSQCIHCGLCLAVCPTYDLTKLERSSPRGRIKMISSVANGEIDISDIFSEEMNFCLDCQACETACPAGVKYGRLVESARVLIDEKFLSSSFRIRIKRFMFRNIVADKTNLKIFAKILRIYQKSFLKGLLEKSGLLKIFSNNLPEISRLTPEISHFFSDEIIPEISKPEGEIKYKTAFHFGCIMNVAFADINKDTIDVLREYSCEVFTPNNQVCCGSLQAHNGDNEFAKLLARKNIDVFEKGSYDYLISNSAGCGAFLKEYGLLLKDDPDYSEKARDFSERVRDVSEFLFDKKPVQGFKNTSIRVTYHDACHLAHSQKVVSEPRELLKSINGLEIVEMEWSNACCGSAGIYNLIRYTDSIHFLRSKMDNIKSTNSAYVVTGNPGCISQIKYGVEKFNCNTQVIHSVSLVKMALDNDNSRK